MQNTSSGRLLYMFRKVSQNPFLSPPPPPSINCVGGESCSNKKNKECSIQYDTSPVYSVQMQYWQNSEGGGSISSLAGLMKS